MLRTFWLAAGFLLLAATRVLGQAPGFADRPLTKLVVAGQPLTVTVSASGAVPLAFQWERNGRVLPGVTGPTLNLAAVSLADDGYYRVRVSNSAGEASSVFSLHVAAANATLVRWGSSGALTLPPNVSGPVAGVVGRGFDFVLKPDGSLVWFDSTISTQSGGVPAGLGNVVAIATCNTNALALKADGTVINWSMSSFVSALTPPADLNNVVAIAAGEFHSLALRSDGTVVGWGNNQSGKITIPPSAVPYVAIAASAQHSSALRADGTVAAWGSNEFGHSNVPADLSNVVGLVEGGDHSVALRADGTVVTWGGTPGDNDVPAGLTGVTAVSAADRHSVALKTDRTVVGWGSISRPTPAGLPPVVAVADAVDKTYALVDAPDPWVPVAPTSRFVPSGNSTTFNAVAVGSPSLAYRWRRNGVDLADGPAIAGSATATLTLSNVQAAAAGEYSLAVSNSLGSSVSASATLTVGVPPAITTQPAPQTLAAGGTATFSVVASGASPLVYQWKRNGTNLSDGGSLSGSTTATLTIGNLQEDNAGTYTVVISDSGGATLSNEAVLAVTGPPVTPLIRQQSNGFFGLVSTPITLSVTAASTMSLSYQWYEGKSGDTTRPLAGETQSTLSLSSGQNIRSYWVRLINPAGTADSREIVVMPWVARDSGLGSAGLTAAAYANGRYFVGRDGGGLVSTDGVSWTSFSYSQFDLGRPIRPAYGNGVYVSGGGHMAGTLFVSTDGVSWDTRSVATSSTFTSVVFNGTLFIAVSDRGEIVTSIDGTTWLLRDNSSTANLNDVTFGQGLNVAVGTGGRVAISANAVNWINVPAFTSHPLLAITYGQGRFVALAGPTSGENFPQIWTSEDGNNWVLRPVPALPPLAAFGGADVVFGGGLFVAAVRNHLLVSSDGLSWASAPNFFPALSTLAQNNLLAYGNGCFLSAGDGGILRQSLPLANVDPITITSTTASQIIRAGETTTIGPSAEGANLSYQWYLGNSGNTSQPIAGATSATLAVTPTQTQTYWVRVSNPYDVIDAPTISVTVVPTPAIIGNDSTYPAAFERFGGYTSGFLRLASGKFLVYGDFTRINGRATRGLARLETTGAIDATFARASVDGIIFAAVEQPDGGLIIGGSFSHVSGITRNGLARLLPNGVLDLTFAPNGSWIETYALALQGDGKLLVGGGFSGFLARVSATGETDITFAPTLNSSVFALTVQSDGRIVAGGAFTTLGGQSRPGLARLNSSGTLDASFTSGGGVNNSVYALTRLSGDRILVAGAFTTCNGSSANRMVRLAASGAIDTDWSIGTGFNSSVYGLDVMPDGRILAAGSFGGFAGQVRTAVARLLANGSIDPAFAPQGFSISCNAVLGLPDGTVMVGGGFTTVALVTQYNLTRLTADGNGVQGSFASSGLGLLSAGTVRRLLSVAGGKIVAAGDFTHVNGISRRHLARLNSDGTLDGSFILSGTGPGDAVTDVLQRPDGRLVAIGAFTDYNGQTRQKIVGLTVDGGIDPNSPGVPSFSGTPSHIYARADGSFVVTTDTQLVSLDPSLAPESGFSSNAVAVGGTINAAVPQANGSVVVGGSFTSFTSGGVTGTPFLVRLQRSGAIDSFSFSAVVDGEVTALAQQPDGKLLIAGAFRVVAGAARAGLARLVADGALDASFVPNFSMDQNITLLSRQPDGRWLAGGPFTVVNDYPGTRYLLRVNANGALDTTFSAIALSGPPVDVRLIDNGSLLIAGREFSLLGVTHVGLARTVSTSGPVILAQPQGASVAGGTTLSLGVVVGGAENISYQWWRNGTALSDGTRSTYSVTGSQASDAGTYLVRITYAGGTIDSDPAVVVVNGSPPMATGAITGFGGTIKAGTRWPLTAPTLIAGNPPISYQWLKNGVPITGATGRLYVPETWQPSDSGVYSVTISNGFGSITTADFSQLVTSTLDWEWRSPLPQGNNLVDATFLNGRFLAGGARGTIVSSTDGQSWTAARLGIASTVNTFSYGNGVYVALASFNSLWSSTDGTNWIPRRSGYGALSSSLTKVAFGNGRFVAVGQSGLVTTSPDGATWTPLNSGTTDSLSAVAYGNGRFIALGLNGRTFVSTAGLSWSAGTVLPRSAQLLAYGNGEFVAAAGNDLFYSTDGTAWTQKVLPTAASIVTLQYSDVGFLAALDPITEGFWKSTNGIDWSRQTTSVTLGGAARSLAHGGGRFVIVDSTTQFPFVSTDGANWSRLGTPTGRNFVAVAAGNTNAMAVTSSGAVQIDSAGSVSPNLLSLFSDVRDVTYANGIFIAVGGSDAGHISIGNAGGDWIPRNDLSGVQLFGVNFLSDRFYAVGSGGSMYVSTDGNNWAARSTGTTQTLLKSAFGGGAYVAVGQNGTLLTSIDGANWTLRPLSGIGSNINDVVFGANQFVLVTEGGSIRTSPDGITWTARTNPLGAALKSITYAAGKFYVFTTGNTNYLVSDDGATWTAAQDGNVNAHADAVALGNNLLLVGANTSVVSLPIGVAPPTITTGPASQNVSQTGGVTLTVAATGTEPFVYQWFKNGTAILGATGPALTLTNVTSADAGAYSVMITNFGGSVTSATGALTVVAGSLSNGVVIGEQLAGAFTVEGPAAKQMLIRAVGPTLTTFGASDVLVDPYLRIFDATTGAEVANNNDWDTAANAAQVASLAAQLGAYPLPAGSKDAAVLASFAPGTYRIVAAAGGGSGTVSIEVFDADAVPRLVYLAARGSVDPTQTFAQGFVVRNPPAGRTYLVRALGPSLGLQNSLADPFLLLKSGSTTLATNNDWAGDSSLAAVANAVGAMPIPSGSKEAAINFTPTGTGVFTAVAASATNGSGIALLEVFEADAQRASTAPVAAVSLPENVTVDAGQSASFGIVTVGRPAPTYQWLKGGAPIAGATGSLLTIPSAQVADAGSYSVQVGNGQGAGFTATASLAVSATNNATSSVVGGRYLAGTSITITNTLHYIGTPTSLGWSAQIPAGWSFAGDGGNAADVKPAVGATGTLNWTWNTPPPSPVTFSYVLNVPAGESGDKSVMAIATITAGTAVQVSAQPNPLPVPQLLWHSGDTNHDFKLSLTELLRVIELYNTRNGTVRTGAYAVDDSNPEDGFATDPARASSALASLARYHSADTNHDGKLSLTELLRVIELYNYRSGTVRTGQYRIELGTEDGFAAGP